MVEYQTLMNLSYLETDIITAEQIDATKIDVSDLTAQNLSITSAITVPTVNATNINTSNFKLTTGAQNDYYLKSDASGNASWATVPAPSNMVTTNTTQLISGEKTFSGNLISSSFKLTSSPSTGYVLTSDINGNGTWQAPASAPTNMCTTDTNQTITGEKTFTNPTRTNGLLVSSGINNTGYISSTELSLENRIFFNKSVSVPFKKSSFFVAPFSGAADRIIEFPDVGSASLNVLYDVGTQTVFGQKAFSGGLITNSFRLTTGAQNDYFLKSDSSGIASWSAVPAPSNMVTTNTTQTITRSKTLNTTDTAVNYQNATLGISMVYAGAGGNEVPYRLIQCPSNMGGYAVSIVVRITGTVDPITASPTVLTAGIRVYKNRESTPFFSINTITATAVVLPGIAAYDSGYVVQAISGLCPADFPLRITAHNSIPLGAGPNEFQILTNEFELNYFVASINDISGIKAYSLKIDNEGGAMLPLSGTVDNEGDNIICIETTDIGGNAVKLKLKDVLKYMYSSLFIPSSFFNFKTTVQPIYSELTNNWWFIDTATAAQAPVIVEVEAKLKKGQPPIFLGFDTAPPLASNTDPIMSNPFLEDRLVRYKMILKQSSTNVGYSWTARTVPAGQYTDGWAGPGTFITYGAGISRLAIFIQCYYGGWFNNNYNTRMTNLNIAGAPTLSRTGENRSTILDYFDVFKIRGYI